MFNITTLQSINLAQNTLKSIAGLGSLTNLTILDLSFNKLDYLSDDFVNLSNLKSLNLSFNILTSRGIPQCINKMKLSVLKLNSNKLTAMCSEFQKFLLGIETFNIEDNPWIDVELHPLSGLAESEQKKFLMKWKREEELKSSENDFVLIRKSTELTKAEADCESEPDRLPINLPGTHHGDSMEEELLELPNRTGGPLKQFIRARPPPRKPLPIPEESPAYASRGLDNPGILCNCLLISFESSIRVE